MRAPGAPLLPGSAPSQHRRVVPAPCRRLSPCCKVTERLGLEESCTSSISNPCPVLLPYRRRCSSGSHHGFSAPQSFLLLPPVHPFKPHCPSQCLPAHPSASQYVLHPCMPHCPCCVLLPTTLVGMVQGGRNLIDALLGLSISCRSPQCILVCSALSLSASLLIPVPPCVSSCPSLAPSNPSP